MVASHILILLIIGGAHLVLLVAAIVSILSTPHISSTARALWVVVALVFTVLGPLVWFATGRRSAMRDSAA